MSAIEKVNGHQQASSVLIPNPAQKPWVVQKFGGTSIGKFAVNIAEQIVRYGCPGVFREVIARLIGYKSKLE